MALTYEDMNDQSADSFDKTAFAILHGVGDYLGILRDTTIIAAVSPKPQGTDLSRIYWKRVGSMVTVAYSLEKPAPVTLSLYDLRGKVLANRNYGIQPAGVHRVQWNSAWLARGGRICMLQAGSTLLSRVLLTVAR